MKKSNALYAVIVIVIGIAAALYARQYGISDQRMRVGAGFFPMIMGIGLAVVGVMMLVSTLIKSDGGQPAPSVSGLPRVILFALVFLGYMWVLKPLGFIPASALIILFCMYQLGCRRWLTMIVYSIVLPGCVFAMFYYFMYVNLPLGILDSVLPKY